MARGTIRRRGESSWELRYQAPIVNGTYRTLTKTVRGKREDAQRKLTELLREKDTGSSVDPSKTTVAQYLDTWLAEIQVGPKTLERYAGLVENQVKRSPIGNVVLQELKPQAIKSWHKWLREQGSARGKPLADRSCLHAHRVLAKALKDARAVQLISSNPVTAVEQPKVEDAEEVEILTGNQPREVLEKLAGNDLFELAHLGLASGCRRGELLALAWPHLDLDRGVVKVERSLERVWHRATKTVTLRFKPPKTKRGRRTITIPPATVAVLREHRKKQLELRMKLGLGKQPADALVFPALDGSPRDPDEVSKAWSRTMVQLDLPRVTLHALRHTHASALIARKVDIVQISRRLGHANPNVTLAVYAHLFEHDDAEAALAIAGVLG